jgi:hypothetical protein
MNASSQVVQKDPAVRSVNTSDKWNFQELRGTSFQQIGRGAVYPPDPPVLVKGYLGDGRKFVFR